MKKIIHSLILTVMIGLLLTSCSPATDTPAALPIIQPTQNLVDKVNIELTVQYDTAAVYNTVGQIIRFKYTIKMVRNDITDAIPANITISGITAACPPLNTISNLNDRFDPGEVIECTGDYILTQADLDKGSVTNMATANAYTVNSNPVTTTVPTVSAKALTLTKTANTTTYYQAGQQIIYTYTVKNSGTVQLGPAQFTVTDTGINNNIPINCGNADATLASGATLSCNATYTVTTADMNLATLASNATVTGGGANPSQPATVTITKVTSTPTVASSIVQHTVREGEWLWQIARCYGADPTKTVAANPQLANAAQLKAGMIVNVPNVGSVGQAHLPPQPCVTMHVIQSGDTWTSIAQKYSADPGLTQMVNANTMITGKEVKVPLYTAGLNLPLVNTTVTTNPSTAALVLTLTPSTTTYSQAGQIITFNYVIKNNGTTTLGPTQFTVTDNFFNPATFNCGPANTTLSAGATTTCTANYTISQADMGAVNIQFSTTAAGGGVPASQAVSTTISKGTSQITLSVTAAPATYNQAGQIIAFTYVIKNSGTTTLSPAQFTVTDNFLNPATINCGPANTTLAPNATVSCTASYTISQADMGAVNIQFSTTAAGGGAPTSQAVPTTITRQAISQ